jgi:Tfp pilus assembly PilM family ATPase
MNIFGNYIDTLNIESDSIRLLRVRDRKIIKFGEAPVPQGLIRNALINDPLSVARILSGLFRTLRIPRSNVIVAVNGFRSVSKTISLPRLKSRLIEEAVMWAAEREMPVPLKSLYIVWQIIEKTEKEQKVYILGIPRDILYALKKTLWIADVGVKAYDSKLLALGRLVNQDDAIIIDLESEMISILVKMNSFPATLQTTVLSPEYTMIVDRVKILTDDLLRSVDFYNANNREHQLKSDTPIFLTGGIITDSIPELVRNSTGRKVLIPEIPLVVPDELPLSSFAVNIGLMQRETNFIKRHSRKSDERVHLDLDITKAKSFNIGY